MATHLVVRNIEPSVAQALKEAAARHGRSAEAEHREILRAALTRSARRSFKDVLASMPDVGADEDFDFRQA
ncbi:DNA-binding protein [Zoogloea sp.]|uniref:FitA-like ribbon-helix-helix domain-containing protein n=1 Tax=Zoogloea sp. TaxID=49181 RepID=UPI0035AF1F83